MILLINGLSAQSLRYAEKRDRNFLFAKESIEKG
jgi:hypothetical protein